jgi:hypothetical protein
LSCVELRGSPLGLVNGRGPRLGAGHIGGWGLSSELRIIVLIVAVLALAAYLARNWVA